MISRKNFVVVLLSGIFGIIVFVVAFFRTHLLKTVAKMDSMAHRSHIHDSTTSKVFLSQNGTPQENVKKVIEFLGGIEKYLDPDDIVILKPNAQWWNQGRTNLAAMKGFIDLVLEIPDFAGEIIIAENQHFMDEKASGEEKDNLRGWTHFSEINGDIDGENHNINTLVERYQQLGYSNITKIHWRDGGPKEKGWSRNGQSGGVVRNPSKGDGYVWSDIDYSFYGFFGLKKWNVKMTYPIFTSKYSDLVVDFKNGVYKRDGKGGGKYLPEKNLKFINFAVLNTHGKDTGITSAVKNYMGVTDLSCGYYGLNPEGYFNVHQCGEEYYLYAKAGPIGHFMKTIRKADLNIVTAEWIGWGHRTDVDKAIQKKTVLASTDPIALDYYSAKYLLYPLTKNKKYHDPDNPNSSVSKFLKLACESCGEGTLNESKIEVQAYDFSV